MDRRTFNKTLGALFGAMVVPGVPKALASVPTTEAAKAAAAGHWGLTSMSATTSFTLEQVFEYGQIGLLEDIDEKPEVDVNISFWIDEERQKERTVYFHGENKTWEYVSGPKVKAYDGADKPLRAVMDTRTPERNVSPVTGRVSDDIGTNRIFYAMTDFVVFAAGTKERVRLDEVVEDECYDLEVLVMDSCADNKTVCTMVLQNFKVTHLEDFDYDENDFQS